MQTTFGPGGQADVRELLKEAATLPGVVAAALIDVRTGRGLAVEDPTLERRLYGLVAAGVGYLGTQTGALRRLTGAATVEEILEAVGGEYHLIRTVGADRRHFLYLLLDRTDTNLMLTRLSLEETVRRWEGPAN